MRDGRHLAALLVVLGALALTVPAVALAGGSAGNNQYTNPFGSGTTSQPTKTTPPQTSSTTVPETTTSAPPPATAVSPATTSPATETTSAVTTASGPTATAAAAPGVGTTAGGKGLPRTGYGVWEIAGFGLVMLAGGFFVRRRGRRT
jgi:LPXTG-motif cell wall-anchored protein